MTQSDQDIEKEQAAWNKHNLSQLLHFRSLALRDKILALEELQRTFQHLQTARAARARKKEPPDQA